MLSTNVTQSGTDTKQTEPGGIWGLHIADGKLTCRLTPDLSLQLVTAVL
jgi:hypothetical protein